MTRFTNNLTGDMGISNEEFDKLFKRLNDAFSSKLKKRVIKEISILKNSERDYRLLEISDTIIISIFKSTKKESVQLCVGYPFPLATRHLKTYFSGYKVSIFIRDEPVRKIQRKYIFNHLKNTYNASLNVFDNLNLFREKLFLTNKQFTQKCFYVDLYDFIGDSIIGLKFLDSLRTFFKIPASKCIVFSKHNKHIPAQYNILNLTDFADTVNFYENSTIIIPVLIDNQFDVFLKLLTSIILKNVRIIIPSRNMFCLFSDKGNQIYWYKSRDILFKTNSIDNYMENVVSIFTGLNHQNLHNKIKVHKLTKNVFINPFSSLAEKSISVTDCSSICEHLLNNGYKVFVSAGFQQDDYLKRLTVRNIKILYDSGFKDLSEKLKSNDIGLVISTDSGIAHMTATLGIATIVIYHSFFWDSYSKQSISNDALGGFCRSHLPMIPVIDSGILSAVDAIYHPTMSQHQAKIIKTALKEMYKASNKTVFKLHNMLVTKFDNQNYFYSPGKLLENVINSTNKTDSWSLVSNIWQNLPAYKISKFTFV